MDFKTDLVEEIMDSSEYVFSCAVVMGEPLRRAEVEIFRAAESVAPEVKAKNIMKWRGSQAAIAD
jgi:hypothetical protein